MSSDDRNVVDHTRAALDGLVELNDHRGPLMEHEERAALRLRQALELLEGTGPGGFMPTPPGVSAVSEPLS